MGELILCHHSIAANPYYMDELSLNIYSLEEMSYYISHNVYLLNAGFMSNELCRWIGSELSMKELSETLYRMIEENMPLHVFVGHLLSACGYLSTSEIRNTVAVIETFENKSEAECAKMRADRLMEKERVVDAIYEYEELIDGELSMSDELKGQIWHNLGTAFARLFFFDEAADCYEEAYRFGHKSASLKSLLYALICAGDDEELSRIKVRYQIPDDMAENIKATAKRVSQSEEITGFSERLRNLRGGNSSQDEYHEQLSRIVDEWKDEYSRMCRI